MAAVETFPSYDEICESLHAKAEAETGGAAVHVSVHDASRLEWSVALPLRHDRALRYSVELDLEMPANAVAPHSPWAQLQSFARLDRPELALSRGDATLDSLRRDAVAAASHLARAGEGFARHCERVVAPVDDETPGAALQSLRVWLEAAVRTAELARRKLTVPSTHDSEHVRRERGLVDEYISMQIISMLSKSARTLNALRQRSAAAASTTVRQVEICIVEALEEEANYRRRRGYVCADPASDALLAGYVERASRLKKHFQQVLFLDPETYQVTERLQHWVSTTVAVLAGAWAFGWQLVLARRQALSPSSLGWSIVGIGMLVGLVYATRERIKESGRNWIAKQVHRFYAQRVARYRAPARLSAGREIVVNARESLHQATALRPDPLNPECGASLPTTVLRFEHRGTVAACASLRTAGVHEVKHVFRYDLSSLFSRLHDAIKPMAVVDTQTRRVRFADAPRVYRIPVRARVVAGAEVHEVHSTLVLSKAGLLRLESEAAL